ncbi:hypothetical protein BH23GEM9_BH23GEM9_12360 [soil metagenome]
MMAMLARTTSSDGFTTILLLSFNNNGDHCLGCPGGCAGTIAVIPTISTISTISDDGTRTGLPAAQYNEEPPLFGVRARLYYHQAMNQNPGYLHA